MLSIQHDSVDLHKPHRGKVIPDESFLQTFLSPAEIRTWGVEIGNWFGFTGIPMGTGLGSFTEFDSLSESPDHVQCSGRVLMPRLCARVHYQTWQDGPCLFTELTLQSERDSLLGDLALHSTFYTPGLASFNDALLTRARRYHYSTARLNRLAFQGGPRLSISSELIASHSSIELDLIPYACLLPDARIRYHTRGLSMGGRNSRLIVRMRGAMNCFVIGPAPRCISHALYRVERKAPRVLRNFQLCAASRFPTGAIVTLKHCMQRC